jgi:hypothetical protein
MAALFAGYFINLIKTAKAITDATNGIKFIVL